MIFKKIPNYSDMRLFDFIYLYNFFDISAFNLFCNSVKIIIKLKYGLYHYFFWIKVGCKNIRWRRMFTAYFLVDFIFSSAILANIINYTFTTIKFNTLPIKRFVYTLSKGPMVRKKQSREQYMLKQIFVNVTKIFHFIGSRNYKKLVSNSKKNINVLRMNQLDYFSDLLKKKNNFYIFKFLNFNINFFLMWVRGLKKLNFFIETNLFYLKKNIFFLTFHDIFFFLI